MADNNELRADIKINVESNAEEAVAKAEKAFDSLNNRVNSQNSGSSDAKKTISDLEDSINKYAEHIRAINNELSTGIGAESLEQFKNYANDIKTIFDNLDVELSDFSSNVVDIINNSTNSMNIGDTISSDAINVILTRLEQVKDELAEIDDIAVNSNLVAQLQAQQEAENQAAETIKHYRDVLDSALEKQRQLTEESLQFFANGGTIGKGGRVSSVAPMTSEEADIYRYYKAHDSKMSDSDILAFSKEMDQLASSSDIANNKLTEIMDTVESLSDEYVLASQAVEQYNILLNNLTLDKVNLDTLGDKKGTIDKTLDVMNSLKELFSGDYKEILDTFNVDDKIHNLEKLNSYLDSTIAKYKDTDSLIESSNGIVEYWEQFDFNDLMPDINKVGIEDSTYAMEALNKEIDTVKATLEQLNNTRVFNNGQAEEIEMLKNNLNGLLGYIERVVDEYSTAMEAIDTFYSNVMVTDIGSVGAGANGQFETFNNTLGDTITLVEKLDLFTDKETQSIIRMDDALSKYAMNVSDIKSQSWFTNNNNTPDGGTNTWFFKDTNEGASYNFKIPEITKQTSELKTESSGLASVLGGELAGAFGKLLPALGAGAVLVSGFKHALNETKEAINDIISISKNLSTALVDAFKTMLNTIDKLIDKCVQLGKKLRSLADDGVTLQQKWFTAYNYLGAQAGTDVKNFLGNMEEIYGLDADNLVSSLREISSLVSNVGLNADDSATAVKALVKQSVDMAAFTGYDYDSIVSNMQSAVNMGYIGRSSPLIRALGLTKDDVEQFKKLNTEAERLNFILSKGEYVRGSYEKWLNTTAGRVTTLNNATSRLRGNTSRLAMTLWARVAPVLTKLVNLVNELVDGLAKLLDLDLTGAEANLADTSKIFDGLGSSTEGLSNGINSVSENLDKTADSADEAKKHLASFDDVIQIPEDTSSDIDDELNGLGGVDELAGTLGNFDFAGLADDIKKTNGALSEFFKLLKEGRYDEAGSWLNNFLQEKLDSIPWNDIKDKVGKTASRLALFLNGLFSDPELFRKIGKTIAEGINTAIIAVRNFAGNLNWASVGKALSQSWKGFWEGFDSKALGQALFNVIHGAFVAFWSFVEDMWKVDEETGANGWVIAGYKIADVINTFFSSWTIEDVEHAAQSIIDFINGVFQMFAAFLKTLDMEDIKEKFRAFIHTLFTGFAEHAGEWGKTLGEFISFIVDLLEITISEWDSTGMSEAILAFIENSHITELLSTWMRLKLKILFTKFRAELRVYGEVILGGILNFIEKIPELLKVISLYILGWALQAGVELSEPIVKLKDKIKEIGMDIVSALAEVLGYIGGLIWDEITKEIAGLENFGGFIYDKVQDVKNGIINAWNEFWDTWKIGADTISGIWNGICEGIKNVFQGVVDFLLGGIEKICGGITGLVDAIHDIPVIGTGMDKLADFTGGIINKIDIPFLASGGIVDRATPAVIGEAGREAVIPLENNTSWMDSFANKLSQRMGGTAQGVPQTVVIDMSKSVKPVYSRSEMVAFGRQVAEALKVYGVQVSVNT